MKLLEDVKLGDLTLKNRMVMAPMTRSRANEKGIVGDLTVIYYSQRSTAGLLITEGINISKQSEGYPNTPGLYSQDQVNAWKKVTTSVHDSGGVIFAQLWHSGRVSHSILKEGEIPVAPSSIRIDGKRQFLPGKLLDYELPRALTTEEVKEVIHNYREAADNAKSAGFDGVELHGANGYLPNEFLVDSVNQRTDLYGGSMENRTRFIMEVMQELVSVWGKGRVGIKLSPSNPSNGISDKDPLPLYSLLINKLNEFPLAYLHLARAMGSLDAYPDLPRDVVGTFGPLTGNILMVNGGYNRETAESEILSNRTQLVSFGTSFLANPDLPERFRLNVPLNQPDRSTFYSGGEKGYIDYPFLGESVLQQNEETNQLKY